MSGGCKLCGKNVIHLVGCCDVYKSSGIRDFNYDNQANYALDTRGKQRQVLFDGVQDCAQLFHLPLRVPDAMFDMPVDVCTAATAADPATVHELPEWINNNFDNDGVVEDLGITFVDGVLVVTDQDDEP